MSPNTFRVMGAFMVAGGVVELTVLKGKSTKWGLERRRGTSALEQAQRCGCRLNYITDEQATKAAHAAIKAYMRE